jgi:hypothetical protein
MSDESSHNSCLAHSGLNVKVNILLSLSTIATGLLIALVPVASSIQAGVSTNSNAIINLSEDSIEARDRMEKYQSRVQGQMERIQSRLRILERAE